jgi:pantoate--beta-alanine ligase
MIVARTIEEARRQRAKLGRLALQPTLGALHVGHMANLEIARRHADHLAVSIFVNPTQFGPREDFDKYPRPLEQDLAKCEAVGVDLAFVPSEAEMYPPGQPAELTDVHLDMPGLSGGLDGRIRPNHFKGVCQIVAKLFNILRPEVAVFGQKDYQQLRIITTMAAALNWPIEIVECPTVREPDGLAMSSRNQYLKPEQRQRALSISKALFAAADDFAKGVRQANRLVSTVQNILLAGGPQGRVPLLIDYVAAVDARTLRNIETVTAPAVLAVAARVAGTRLIDNVILNP